MKYIMFFLMFLAFVLGVPAENQISGQGTSYLPQFARQVDTPQNEVLIMDEPLSKTHECGVGSIMRFKSREQFEVLMYHRAANFDMANGYWNEVSVIEITPLYEKAGSDDKPSWVMFIHHARIVGEQLRWDLSPTHWYCYEVEPSRMWEWAMEIIGDTSNTGGKGFAPTCE